MAIKFNSAGASIIGTTAGVAAAMIGSLTDAGFDRSRLMLIDVPAADTRDLGTTRPPTGWTDGEYDFNSGRDRLAEWVLQADAIINVPFVKTHNIAGFTCGLKNLSHAVVKHPGRYHATGCNPYIYDIWRLEPIQRRLRLTMADGLRPAVKNGPHPASGDLFDAGELFFAVDGVALDAAALAWLNLRRYEVGLTSVESSFGSIPYLLEQSGSPGSPAYGVRYRVRQHRV